MLGLGETESEIIEVFKHWSEVGCDIITIGQYLQPTKDHLPVVNFITPEIFEHYGLLGKEMGFRKIFSGPLVRSSYHAAEQSALKC